MSGRRVLFFAMVPYAVWLVFGYRYHFIDGVNLLFHEAGHVFFGILGQTMHFLGGTLGQLVFPVVTAVHFRRDEPYRLTSSGVPSQKGLALPSCSR